MSFTSSCEPQIEPIWRAIEHHPMVTGIGEGSLDPEPFMYWVKQDYVYLIEYSRVFAYGAARAPTLDNMGTFATLLSETLHTEMDLHRSYAAEFGISTATLKATEPSPTTQAYTDFLVRTAALEPVGQLIAVLLPCMWGFNEIGKRLDEKGKPDHPQYAAWIDMYASEEFSELTDWCMGLMDQIAARSTASQRNEFQEKMITSAQYEYLFWDAAWREESWPVSTGSAHPN